MFTLTRSRPFGQSGKVRLEGGTWVGEMPEGTKIAFETLCTGSYTYSHPFLPVLDHDHEFNHPFHDYNFAGYWSAPCNRVREFPVSAGQSFSGPDGGEIRAHILSTTEIESRWKNGRTAATVGEDYTAGSGTLTFAPGEASKSVAIAIIDDTMDEPPERFEVALAICSMPWRRD